MPDDLPPEPRRDPVRRPVVPLEYHREPTAPLNGRDAAAILAGALLGTGAVALAGIYAGLTGSVFGSAGSEYPIWMSAIAFGVLGIVATILAIRQRRRGGRTLASLFLQGLLLGVGLTGLVEGTCFGVASQ